LSSTRSTCKLGGLKVYADGSFGAFTACMNEPYADVVDGEKGFMVRSKPELVRLFKEADDLGFQIICHAIGDKANRIVVHAFKDALVSGEIHHQRNRIEHASMLTSDVLVDAAKLGLVFVCQPSFIISERDWLERRLGPERIKYTYPFKFIIDAGIVLAGATDAPVESPSILKAIEACVTRCGLAPEQAITVNEALKMFTINAAYAIHQENLKGSLEKGKNADFLVLDNDLLSVKPGKIHEIQILATFKKGEMLYQSGGS